MELDTEKPDPELGAGCLDCLPLVDRKLVPEHCRAPHIRKRVFQELKALHAHLDLLQEDTRDPSTGPGKALHEATLERIVIDGDHYDRNRVGCYE